MATIIRMPEIATGSDAASIATWLVTVDQAIAVGQPLVEIETEKATVEYEAPGSGTLIKILLKEGIPAEVGTPIAVLAAEGQSPEEAMSEVDGQLVQAATSPKDASPQDARQQDEDDEARSSTAEKVPTSQERVFASPLVRKIARQQNLDLRTIQGTGPGGRIVRRDLEALSPEAAPSAPSNVSDAPSPSNAESTYTDIPPTGMRKAIARRLTESKTSVPHFYLKADCRVDALLNLRKQVNELNDVRVSVNDFVVKAVAAALQDVPDANVIWTDSAIRKFSGVDISVAVSVEGGLLTPVVRGVERLSLTELSSTIRDYADRARNGKIKQQELEGGSFSVSNLGMYGTSEFTAILNPPQSGILAVGAAEKRPVIDEEGQLSVGTMMTVSLSADHRALDGAVAAEWLAAFQQRIENPLSLLI